MLSAQERLNSKTYVQDGHLLWAGALDSGGYGLIGANGSMVGTHRVSWEIAYGPIPEGLNVLHLCATPPCIRPEHLYLGTQADNAQDRLAAGNDHNARKTHCMRGHPFDKENTYLYPAGERNCRICCRDQRRARRSQ